MADVVYCCRGLEFEELVRAQAMLDVFLRG